MITFILVGIAFATIELTLVTNWPSLLRIIDRNPIIELIFSLTLGVVVGVAMGIPAGVTIAIGNVFATLITKTIYSLNLIDRTRLLKQWLKAVRLATLDGARSLTDLGKLIVAIIMAPIRFTMAVLNGLNKFAGFVNRVLPGPKA